MRLSYHWRQTKIEFLKMTSIGCNRWFSFSYPGVKFSRPDWPDQFKKFIFDVIWVSFTRSRGINKRFYSSLENINDAWLVKKWVISLQIRQTYNLTYSFNLACLARPIRSQLRITMVWCHWIPYFSDVDQRNIK